MGINRKIKIYRSLCIIGAVATVVVLIIALLSPAKGYETSIYTSTPLIVWILIAFNITLSVTLVFREAYLNKDNKRWLFALFILMANCLLVLLMSVIRGYFVVGSDTLVHIGYVKDLANGVGSPLNVYPLLHVIPTIFVRLGVSVELATNLSPLYWYLIYVGSFYWLAKLICQSKSEIILMTTLSALLFLPHSISLAGSTAGVAIFPLTLVLIVRVCREFNIINTAILLVFIAMLIYFYPLAVEIAVVAFILACFVLVKRRKVILLVLLGLLVGITAWVAINRSYLFSEIFNDIVSSFSSAKILPSLSGIELTQVNSTLSAVALLLRRFGSEIVLGGIAVISLFWMARSYIRNRNKYYLYFGLLFIIINLMWVAGWYMRMPNYNFTLIRMMYWAVPSSILLVAWFVARLLKRYNKALTLILVLIVLLPISLFGIVNKHGSSFLGVANTQETYQHVKGIQWLVENGNPSIYIVHLNGQRTSRYVAEIYGGKWLSDNREYYRQEDMEYVAYAKFSYNEYETMGEAYDRDIYLVVTKKDRTLLSWERDKLYKIETDPTATLIYQDGDEFQAYYVRGTK